MSGRQNVQQSAKHFADQLNKGLDELGAPTGVRERSIVLSKMLHITKQQAWALLEGQVFPDENLLQQIAEELEMDVSSFLKK
jgi:transcriptional regulator with XRE-family HTH domain